MSLCLSAAHSDSSEEVRRITIDPLPHDYTKWSSTVIFFDEQAGYVDVFAFDCDHCCVYYVVSYKPYEWFYGTLGYTVGASLVYFVGDAIFDEQRDELFLSREVKAYNIVSREWLKVFPKLNHPKPDPFVFFLFGRLYVLSSDLGSRFEMLDVNSPCQEWVPLSEPPVGFNHVACKHHQLIDYSNMVLYLKLVDWCGGSCTAVLYGYSVKDDEWHVYVHERKLSSRTANLLKACWANHCVIQGNCLYRFQMLQYTAGLRAMLIVHRLDHEIEVHDNEVQWDSVDDIRSDHGNPLIGGVSEVDISEFLPKDVLSHKYAAGYLVYVGKKNSGRRFSLVVKYKSQFPKSDSIEYNLFACTFDLRRDTTGTRISAVKVCNSRSLDWSRGRLLCKKLSVAQSQKKIELSNLQQQ